jgi:hypothetical protein
MTRNYRLEKFIEKNLDNSKIAGLSIFRIADNHYVFFGKYSVIEHENKYTLSSLVINKIVDFYDIKNALSWCVFYGKNKYKECKDIERLDSNIESVNTEIALYTKLIESKAKLSQDQTFIYEAKLTELFFKRKVISKNLNKLINTSKNWQKKQYAKVKS